MINKTFSSFDDFVIDFLFAVMDRGDASIIISYEDIGIVQSLNEKTVNGNSLCLIPECFEAFDSDVLAAKNGNGLMVVSVFDNGEIVTEPVLYTSPEAWPIETTYYVECDAVGALDLPLNGTVISFKINYDR